MRIVKRNLPLTVKFMRQKYWSVRCKRRIDWILSIVKILKRFKKHFGWKKEDLRFLTKVYKVFQELLTRLRTIPGYRNYIWSSSSLSFDLKITIQLHNVRIHSRCWLYKIQKRIWHNFLIFLLATKIIKEKSTMFTEVDRTQISIHSTRVLEKPQILHCLIHNKMSLPICLLKKLIFLCRPHRKKFFWIKI